ncbi:MAG: AAA family ATPase [Candidatus Altiarchaeia archaeon]
MAPKELHFVVGGYGIKRNYISKAQIKRVGIQNFKSLKKVEIEFDKFNVVVGPNGAGKTNIIDAFRFLQEITSSGVINPYVRYGGYKNIVWKHNEELQVSISISWETTGKKGDEFQYSITVSGYNGTFDISRESIIYKGFTLIREREKIRIVDDAEKFDLELELGTKDRLFLHRNNSLLNIDPYNLPLSSLKTNTKIGGTIKLDDTLSKYYTLTREIKNQINKIRAYNFYPKSMKMPYEVQLVDDMGFEGEKLQAFLYTILSKQNYSWKPEIIDRLKLLFPNVENLSLIPTEDGRIMLRVIENGIELKPQSLSDGFLKVLAILVLSSEIKESVILIDELENSVYPEAIEVLTDALRESENTIICTTHSPVVLNTANIEEILLATKESTETTIARVKNPKKLRKELRERGISIGNGWLYQILE